MNPPDRLHAWQCIGCGRLDAPQPCVGVCEDRRVELVPAAEYRRLWDRHQAALALLQRIAHVQPRAGQFEAAWTAVQADARRCLAPADGNAAEPGP